MNRLLTSSSALFWGLQFAFLNPALALLLVSLYGATPADLGWVLAVYNASGFLASLLIPAFADARADYLRPMLGCGILTLLLAIALALTTSLPLAVVALIVFGGPAGVGTSLLFAHLRHSGESAATVMNTRAVSSVAWVAGPPVATLVMGAFGSRAILPVLILVALLNIATTALLLSRRRRALDAPGRRPHDDDHTPLARGALVAVVTAFVLLQATNAAAVSVMTLFVSERLHAPMIWAGVTLGAAALLEVPALMILGRISDRFSSAGLLIVGSLVGAVYYAGMAVVTAPILMVLLQVLNAWFFATVTGVGMVLFQTVISRPGLATGLFMNTRRIGAILSGPIIGIGAGTALGYPGVFAVTSAATVLALVLLLYVRSASRRTEPAARDAG